MDVGTAAGPTVSTNTEQNKKQSYRGRVSPAGTVFSLQSVSEAASTTPWTTPSCLNNSIFTATTSSRASKIILRGRGDGHLTQTFNTCHKPPGNHKQPVPTEKRILLRIHTGIIFHLLIASVSPQTGKKTKEKKQKKGPAGRLAHKQVIKGLRASISFTDIWNHCYLPGTFILAVEKKISEEWRLKSVKFRFEKINPGRSVIPIDPPKLW